MFIAWFANRTFSGPISWHELFCAVVLISGIRPAAEWFVAQYFILSVRWYAQRAVWKFLSGDFQAAQHFSRKAVLATTHTSISSREVVAILLFVHGRYEDAAKVIGRAVEDDFKANTAARRFFERVGLFYPTGPWGPD